MGIKQGYKTWMTTVVIALTAFCVIVIPDVVDSSSVKVTRKHQTSVTHDRRSNITTDDTTGFGSWSKWYQCTTRCRQKRTRKCKDQDKCDGTVQEQTKTCDFGKCRNKNRAQVRRGISRRLQDMVFNLLYNEWSDWSMCTRSCKQRRFRTCAMPNWCKNVLLMEEKRCYHEGTVCELALDQEIEFDPEEIDDIDEEFMDSNKKKKPDVENKATPPDPLTCGKRPAGPSLRIVGGYEARKGSWPWQVAITNRRGDQYCGGVLIAPQWVLTAAHCIRKNGRKRRILVKVGEHDLMKYEGMELEMEADTDFPHPDFDIDTIDNDIALVKLKTPVPKKLHLEFACVPRPDDLIAINTLCYAVGWGKIKETHRFGTDVLREAPVPLVSDIKCQGAFEYAITKSQMCAGYRRGGIDTCAGDSGGPLMCEIQHGGATQWYVYGVTSFGEGCGDKGKYGIYTKLTMFSDWINDITSNN